MRAQDETRTRDPFLTMEVLYQLSYLGVDTTAPARAAGVDLRGSSSTVEGAGDGEGGRFVELALEADHHVAVLDDEGVGGEARVVAVEGEVGVRLVEEGVEAFDPDRELAAEAEAFDPGAGRHHLAVVARRGLAFQLVDQEADAGQARAGQAGLGRVGEVERAAEDRGVEEDAIGALDSAREERVEDEAATGGGEGGRAAELPARLRPHVLRQLRDTLDRLAAQAEEFEHRVARRRHRRDGAGGEEQGGEEDQPDKAQARHRPPAERSRPYAAVSLHARAPTRSASPRPAGRSS